MSDPAPTPGDDQPPAGERAAPRVPVVKLTPVPVYNCRVYLSGPGADGTVAARCANLPEVSVAAPNEREALQRIVVDFKAALARYQSAGSAIPWLDPPAPAEPYERQRLIGVHL